MHQRSITCICGLALWAACLPGWAQGVVPQAEPEPEEGAGLPWRVTFGAKLWVNSWDTWVTSPIGTGVAVGASRFQVVQSVSSSDRVSVIPSVSIRGDRWSATASMMARTKYTLSDAATPGGFDVSASREEADISAGYYITPSLAATVGFKRLTQTYGPDKYRWQGPTIGISGSAPLASQWSLYGNVAAGFMKADFPAAQADVTGKTSFDADYRIGEVGLAYALPVSPVFLKSIVFTFGYRAQWVSTKGYTLAVTDPGGASRPNTTTRLKDSTQGWVLGIFGSF